MLSNRLKNTAPSVTIGISSKVRELKSKGIEILNLSIGDPDFKVPKKAIDYGVKSLNENVTKYDLANGMKSLRDEICEKLLNENNVSYSSDEIVVSSGAKNCLTNAMLVLLNEGDEVLIPTPYWVSYTEIVKILEGNPVLVETKKENDFKVTVDEIKKLKSDKTKALLINNPQNPTGVIYSKSELSEIVDYCYENNIYIIADEIYERIDFYDKFVSIASISDKAKEITITINGFSKSFAMTGLRVGYSASNKEIANGIKNIQGHLISHPSLTSQYVALGALKECEKDCESMKETYKKRCEIAMELVDEIENISYIKPDGAFYLFIDISNLKDKFNYKDSFSVEFCEKLLDEKQVALVPGIAFGNDDFIRISFATTEEIIKSGINRLKEFIESI